MTKNTSLFQKDMMQAALKQSFLKLNPKQLFRNPVMFTVEIGTAVMFFVCIWILMGEQSQGSFMYNFIVFLVLLLTLLFANFAEAIAEARGKAQADSLRKTREETPARKISEVGKFHAA
jgi:K+-transporting ATPase ATPase B chain